MKRKRSAGKRRSDSPSHFSGAQIHQLRRKALSRKRITGKPLADELLRLAVHLSQQCVPCWRAVDDLAPRLSPLLRDPVTDALARLADTRAPLDLTVDHRLAVQEVRERAFGFAYVVLDEALAQVLARAMGAAPGSELDPDVENFLLWAKPLMAKLEEAVPDPTSPELNDVAVYLSCRQAEIHLMNGGLIAAHHCLEKAHATLPGSTGLPEVLVGVHELEATLCEAARLFQRADECYQEALDLLGVDRALRRFEIRALATEMLFRRPAPPETICAAFASALAELPSDVTEPIERLTVVNAMARSTRQLANLARDGGLQSWPGIPEALLAVEQARPLYREYGDDFARELADRIEEDLTDLATQLAPVAAN